MPDLLLHIVRHAPVLVPLTGLGWAFVVLAPWLSATFAINDDSRQLVADVRLAMKRADLSLDFVARCTRVPVSKLSDQLNSKTPFTSFWRFIAPEILASHFWHELFALRAERQGGIYVRGELAALVRSVQRLVSEKEKEQRAS